VKVAFLSFAFGEYSLRLTSALSKHAEVGLWLTRWQSNPHLHELGSDVDFRPFVKPRMREPGKQILLMRRLVEDLRRFSPDVLHLQQGYLWFNPLLRFLDETPLVVTVHDPQPHVGDRLGSKTPQFVARIAYRRADQLIVHNSQMRDEMVSLGAPRDRLNIVPTVVRGHEGIDVDVAEEDGVVLFFGRIWKYKGLHHLIRAEPMISEKVPNLRIIIAGAGEDFDRYRALMVNPDRFEVYNEYVPHDRVPRLFRRAAVVALPYIDATQSGVIATAYNFGRPVVATTVGGLPSMVDHGRTGLLIPPRDERALADAIVMLLSNTELRRRLGRGARARAVDEFSPASVAERTLDVYRQALRS
jgi:glycosyltransferase involved in cell wall biosynthesis